jgi:hypothetical protein
MLGKLDIYCYFFKFSEQIALIVSKLGHILDKIKIKLLKLFGHRYQKETVVRITY